MDIMALIVWTTRLWSQILTSFIVPQVPKIPHKDRKLTAVGLTRMLTESQIMRSEPTARSWYARIYDPFRIRFRAYIDHLGCLRLLPS